MPGACVSSEKRRNRQTFKPFGEINRQKKRKHTPLTCDTWLSKRPRSFHLSRRLSGPAQVARSMGRPLLRRPASRQLGSQGDGSKLRIVKDVETVHEVIAGHLRDVFTLQLVLNV